MLLRLCNKIKLAVTFIVITSMLGCGSVSQRKMIDRYSGEKVDDELGWGQKDYEDFYRKHNNEKYQDYKNDNFLNELEPIIAEPPKPALKKDKLVTLSITNDVDIKDVLMELARLAEIDIEIDHRISGGIILKVTDKPLTEVIDRVSQLAGLRYTVRDSVLKVELDTPYLVNYPVDFINMVRSSRSNYKVSMSMDSSSSDSGGSTVGTGSDAEIQFSREDDLWNTIVSNITQIIDTTGNTASPAPILNTMSPDSSSSQSASASPSAVHTTSVNNIATALSSMISGGNTRPYVNVNKQAGVINVFADSRAHKNVKAYLAQVRSNVSAQALIEAKVVEVVLNDQYKSGINWNVLDRNFGGADFSFNPVGELFEGAGNFALGIFNKAAKANILPTTKRYNHNDPAVLDSLVAAVNLMEMFGVTRTLSSPRVHAMNNQQAILSFAKNHVYFKINIDTDNTAAAGGTIQSTNVTSELKTVPIGLVLSLQPTINTETNEITMAVRPTLSRIVSHVQDPSVAFAISNLGAPADISSPVPVVEVKEVDSVLKIKSGDIMVIGGMMEERYETTENGIPGIKNLPFIGNAFKSNAKNKQIIQTVVFIKATIIPGGSSYSKSDKDFYNQFAPNDPNPFSMR